jgi:3-oxoacyl-[acyl-carrier-protein] synthase-3
MNAKIEAISSYFPKNRLTNFDINEAFPEWSIEKIAEKTGIFERPISEENETSGDMAVKAAEELFKKHNIDRSRIDFVILCTQSPDYFLPTTACLIQDRLGLRTDIGAFDFNLGCSGFIYGLAMAKGLIETGSASSILLLTSETYSKFIHPKDKSVRTIFSDGAAATLISVDSNEKPKIGPFIFGTNGKGGESLIVKTGGMRNRFNSEIEDKPGACNLYMNGPDILNFTLSEVPKTVEDLLIKAGLKMDQVDKFIFHQANKFILEKLKSKIKIPDEKFVINLEKTGNSVSSTIPIALEEEIASGRIVSGDLIMLVGFGVGLSWGATLIKL